MTVERREGPTPAGGSYSEAIRDDEGRLVEIVEYDESGVPLARTYAADLRIVAERGEGRSLIVETGEPPPPDREPSGPVGRIYDRETGEVGPPLLVGSILATGYWNEWDPGPTDEIVLGGFEETRRV
jgi:hypothetical protein